MDLPSQENTKIILGQSWLSKFKQTLISKINVSPMNSMAKGTKYIARGPKAVKGKNQLTSICLNLTQFNKASKGKHTKLFMVTVNTTSESKGMDESKVTDSRAQPLINEFS